MFKIYLLNKILFNTFVQTLNITPMSAQDFQTEVISLSKPLKYFALNLTSNDEDAKDLLQETLFKAISNRHRFIEKTNLKAWCYTIMKNIFINNYRRTVKANTIVDNTKDLYFLNIPQQSNSFAPESKYSEREILKKVDSLENEYKIPFTMYFDGYKYKEIADYLDLPIGTVKSRIFLARKQLMTMLKGYSAA